MIKLLVVSCLWVLTAISVNAQSPRRFLELSGGLSRLQSKDQFHSAYTYRGTGFGVQAAYGLERARTRWQLEAGFSQVNPQSVVSRKALTRLGDLAIT